jgi:hypothetical protein
VYVELIKIFCDFLSVMILNFRLRPEVKIFVDSASERDRLYKGAVDLFASLANNHNPAVGSGWLSFFRLFSK